LQKFVKVLILYGRYRAFISHVTSEHAM